MNEFDDLLDEVLSQEEISNSRLAWRGGSSPLFRLRGAQFSTQKAIWVGTAAVLLMGVVGEATWTMVRTRKRPLW